MRSPLAQLTKTYRAAADGLEDGNSAFHFLLDIGRRHNAQVDELRQQGRVGFRGNDLDRERCRRPDLLDRAVVPVLGALEVLVEDPVEARLHVRGRQRVAVLEFNPRLKGELPRGRRDRLPALRDAPANLPGRGIARQERIEDVPVHVVAVRIILESRVERRGVVPLVDRDLPGDGATRRSARDDEAAEQGGERECRRCMKCSCAHAYPPVVWHANRRGSPPRPTRRPQPMAEYCRRRGGNSCPRP